MHAREDSIIDAWGNAFITAYSNSPQLFSRMGSTRCGECLCWSSDCIRDLQLGNELPPGLLRPCKHPCLIAFCTCRCVYTQSLGKSVLLLKFCSFVVRVADGHEVFHHQVVSPIPGQWMPRAATLCQCRSGSWMAPGDELLRGADVTSYCCWRWTQISFTKACTSTAVVFWVAFGPTCPSLYPSVQAGPGICPGSAQPHVQVENLQDSSQDQQCLVFEVALIPVHPDPQLFWVFLEHV